MILEMFLFSIKPKDYVRKHVLVKYRCYASCPCLYVSGFPASALGELWSKLILVLLLGLFLAGAPADPQYTVYLSSRTVSFLSFHLYSLDYSRREHRLEGSCAHYYTSSARTQIEGMVAKLGSLSLIANLTHSQSSS